MYTIIRFDDSQRIWPQLIKVAMRTLTTPSLARFIEIMADGHLKLKDNFIIANQNGAYMIRWSASSPFDEHAEYIAEVPVGYVEMFSIIFESATNLAKRNRLIEEKILAALEDDEQVFLRVPVMNERYTLAIAYAKTCVRLPLDLWMILANTELPDANLLSFNQEDLVNDFIKFVAAQ